MTQAEQIELSYERARLAALNDRLQQIETLLQLTDDLLGPEVHRLTAVQHGLRGARRMCLELVAAVN